MFSVCPGSRHIPVSAFAARAEEMAPKANRTHEKRKHAEEEDPTGEQHGSEDATWGGSEKKKVAVGTVATSEGDSDEGSVVLDVWDGDRVDGVFEAIRDSEDPVGCVKKAIREGCPLDARDGFDRCGLFLAVVDRAFFTNRACEAVRECSSLGLDINAQGLYGTSLLHDMLETGNKQHLREDAKTCIKALLEAGADPVLPYVDLPGEECEEPYRTPVQEAVEFGSTELLRVLVEFMETRGGRDSVHKALYVDKDNLGHNAAALIPPDAEDALRVLVESYK